MMVRCRGRWFGVWVFGLVLVACGNGSNAEDERRLAIVMADPLLDVRPADAQVDPELDGSGSMAQGSNPNLTGCCTLTGAVLEMSTTAPLRTILDLYLDAFDDGDWQDIGARCSSLGEGYVTLSARQEVDGFTLMTFVEVSPIEHGSSVLVVIQAPFHTSSGQDVVGAEPSLDCVDKPEPTS